MEKILHKVNLIGGALVALLSGLLGEFWYLFCAFLVLNVVDYVTGILKARFTKTENSMKGWQGIVKKVGYWVCIAIGFFIAVCFTEMGKLIGIDLAFTELFGWFTLATFIINEIRSILENLVILGVDVPEFLIKGLSVTSEMLHMKAEGEEILHYVQNDSGGVQNDSGDVQNDSGGVQNDSGGVQNDREDAHNDSGGMSDEDN